MLKTALLIFISVPTAFADGLVQAQLPATSSMVVLPAERAHVIGKTPNNTDIEHADLVWFVADFETPMDAVDNLEESERLAAIEEEKKSLAEAASENQREPVSVAQGAVLFAFNAKQVRRITTLKEVLRTLTKYPDASVEVVGHTDAVGSNEENQKLGFERAAHVSAWLKAHNVAPDRISTSSKGESEPADTNDTSAGRKKNRRAVVTVYIKRGKLSTESVGNNVDGDAQALIQKAEVGSAQKVGSNE